MVEPVTPPAPALPPTHEDLVKRLDALQVQLEELQKDGVRGPRVQALEKKIEELEASLKAKPPAPPASAPAASPPPAAPRKKRAITDWLED